MGGEECPRKDKSKEVMIKLCSEMQGNLFYMCSFMAGEQNTAGRLKLWEWVLISSNISMVQWQEIFQKGGILLFIAEFQQYLGSLFSNAASCFCFLFSLWLSMTVLHIHFAHMWRTPGKGWWVLRIYFPAVSPLKGHWKKKTNIEMNVQVWLFLMGLKKNRMTKRSVIWKQWKIDPERWKYAYCLLCLENVWLRHPVER